MHYETWNPLHPANHIFLLERKPPIKDDLIYAFLHKGCNL